MSIQLSKINFQTHSDLEKSNYLLTNGLGGYSSLTLAQSLTRNDLSFFMAADGAPNKRIHYVRQLEEILTVDGHSYHLTSQSYVNYRKDTSCFLAFESFNQDVLPVFTYYVEGVIIEKTLVMSYLKNEIGVRYRVTQTHRKDVQLSVIPKYAFCLKGDDVLMTEPFIVDQGQVIHQQHHLHYKLKAFKQETMEAVYDDDLYFAYDERDGRKSIGQQVTLHSFVLEGNESEATLIFSDQAIETTVDQMIALQTFRIESLYKQANVSSSFSKQLVRASDQFLVQDIQSNTWTMIAGYPFFADWGRDTMIGMIGCCIATNQFDKARSMFNHFIKTQRNGLIANVFEEHVQDPRYNTIDAPLLMIVSMYEYYQASHDIDFIIETCLPTIHEIINAYKLGTDFGIHMKDNGLIYGGSGLEQLTWMDVCINDYLPTPRHGAAVEINALWYNVLCIYDTFMQLSNQTNYDYDLIQLVHHSFNTTFYNPSGYLNDVIGDSINNQIRPNQAYAIGLPFKLLSQSRAISVIEVIDEHLNTSLGLRTLSPFDQEFKPLHTGSLYNRDMAYHQGTVWPFMSGQYFKGVLDYCCDDQPRMHRLQKQINYFQDAMYEGCIGQIAEIYDGLNPTQSRGCFAQAWSISEILRIVLLIERSSL